jgi:hypothetical protein
MNLARYSDYALKSVQTMYRGKPALDRPSPSTCHEIQGRLLDLEAA